MVISVNGMNRASEYLLQGFLNGVAGGAAGEVVLESAPLGVLWGVSRYAIDTVATKWLFTILPLSDDQASQTAQFVAALAVRLLSLVAAVGLLSAAGVTITTPVITGMIFGTFWRVICLNILANLCNCRSEERIPTLGV